MDWVVAYRKDRKDNKKPSKMQINKFNITYIEVYDDHINIYLTYGVPLTLYLSDWEISF